MRFSARSAPDDVHRKGILAGHARAVVQLHDPRAGGCSLRKSLGPMEARLGGFLPCGWGRQALGGGARPPAAKVLGGQLLNLHSVKKGRQGLRRDVDSACKQSAVGPDGELRVVC